MVADDSKAATPRRRAVVLFRDGEVLEAPVAEESNQLRLSFPEGALTVPLGEVRQVFYSSDRETPANPAGFDAVLGDPKAFADLLRRQPRPLRNTLLIRAILRKDGREAANAYAAEHDRSTLLGDLSRWMRGTEAGREIDSTTLLHLLYDRRELRIEFEGETQLTLDVEQRPSHDGESVVIHFPEGNLKVPRTQVKVAERSARAQRFEEEGAFEKALTSARAFDEYRSTLTSSEATAAVLRALLRDDGQDAAASADADKRTALQRLIVRAAEDAPPAEAAAKALAVARELGKLEPAFLRMLNSGAAWRRRLALRGLATLYARTPEANREGRFSDWRTTLGSDRAALSALLLALEHDSEVLEILSAPGAPVDPILRLIADAGRPYPAATVLTLAQDGKGETRILALAALRASHDISAVEPLIRLLRDLEGGKDADPGLTLAVQQTLGVLTKLAQPKRADEWADAWGNIPERIQSTVERAMQRDAGIAGRVSAWGELAELGVPTLKIDEAVVRALETGLDVRILEAVVAAVVRLRLTQPSVARLLVKLLSREDTRGFSHKALTQLFGGALSPSAAYGWLEVINARSFAAPFSETGG